MSLKIQVSKDIELCKQIIDTQNLEAAQKTVLMLTGAYVDYIPRIRDDLTFYRSEYSLYKINVDYLYDIELIRKKLVLFSLNECTPIREFWKADSNPITSINKQKSNTNEIDITFDDVRENIIQNNMLHPDQICEILENIYEIQQVYISLDNRNTKWRKLKGSLEWLSNKEVDIATQILPLVLKTIAQQ